MASFPNAGSGGIVRDIAAVIVENRAYLSEIDGKIGDGDHGVNMAKGFGRAAERIAPDASLSDALSTLSDVLMSEIGGSMGPLYGMFFAEMSETVAQDTHIDGARFAAMLRAGLEGIEAVGAAKVGDKTMIDALVPAVEAAEANRSDITAQLREVASAAEAGRDSTTDMVAKLGRAARLGERSRGVPDAGATSCALILRNLCDGAARRLEQG
ncbi:dihydroxyacetone kinase subunit L [Palleronia sediminis]|uniref:Dihydroxyacetone kinase subunit L n=1 Tax=Palleronia sediminis TaxID=2547833 RepID=A0A4R6A416_9RHOB|nr:dihydroxyacetone kinase subunit DhaL [Palleronia sediminis]TDL78340.1 dihydroxyacetone kinase subunit L [Palleronia sediminis]